jgi:sulfatase maturation enzyme AslB (radical SAM superfamily)
MITKELLEKELYSINHEWKTIFYAPLTREFDIQFTSNGKLNKSWFDKATDILEVPEFVHNKSFSSLLSKIKIRLNITNRCNLHCKYCSVNANSWEKFDMPNEIMYYAINNLFEYTKKNNADEIELTFSWWEPTLQQKKLKKS